MSYYINYFIVFWSVYQIVKMKIYKDLEENYFASDKDIVIKNNPSDTESDNEQKLSWEIVNLYLPTFIT